MTWTHPLRTELAPEDFVPPCCETSKMLTLGIDLATEPSKTALASIRWENGRATVVELCRGKTKDGERLTDDVLVDRIRQADLTGIDCPFGWPEPFRAFLQAQAREPVDLLDAPGDPDWRRTLAYRQTDEYVGQQLAERLKGKGKQRNPWAHMPLSVSTDRLGLTAMRMASLSAKLAKVGITIDKSGSTGKVIEVYPAASLAMWGLPNNGYKGADKRGALGELVDKLQSKTPWLDLED